MVLSLVTHFACFFVGMLAFSFAASDITTAARCVFLFFVQVETIVG